MEALTPGPLSLRGGGGRGAGGCPMPDTGYCRVDGAVHKLDGEPVACCRTSGRPDDLAVVPSHDAVPSAEGGARAERVELEPASRQLFGERSEVPVERQPGPGRLV